MQELPHGSQLDRQRRQRGREGWVISQTTDNNSGGKRANVTYQIIGMAVEGKGVDLQTNKGDDARRSVMNSREKSI